MRIILLRISGTDKSTLGQLYVDGDPFCFTMEDQKQEGEKVKGETRIPEGIYKLGLREVVSPLTEKYRSLYPWFTYHIQILDVPNFDYVYLHVGNDKGDTDGCPLLGNAVISNNGETEKFRDGFLGDSSKAFARFYKLVQPLLQVKEEEVTIEVRTYKP